MKTKVEPTVEGWELKAKEALKEKMLYFPIDSILDEMIAGLKPIIEQYTQEKLQEGLDKSSPNFFSMWGHCLDEHNHKKNEQFSWSKTLRKWYKEKKITQKQYRPIKHLILQAITQSVQQAKAEERERILEAIQPAVNDFMAAANTLVKHKMVKTAKEMRENTQYIVCAIRGTHKEYVASLKQEEVQDEK